MRTLFIIPLVLLSLVSFPSWGLSMEDLVYREGIYYKKFTDVPFTGEVKGRYQGKLEKGKRDGHWVAYHPNGQLFFKGAYKNGVQEGFWEMYYPTGQLNYKGVFSNGKWEGDWVYYNANGDVADSGTFQNGVKVSD